MALRQDQDVCDDVVADDALPSAAPRAADSRDGAALALRTASEEPPSLLSPATMHRTCDDTSASAQRRDAAPPPVAPHGVASPTVVVASVVVRDTSGDARPRSPPKQRIATATVGRRRRAVDADVVASRRRRRRRVAVAIRSVSLTSDLRLPLRAGAEDATVTNAAPTRCHDRCRGQHDGPLEGAPPADVVGAQDALSVTLMRVKRAWLKLGASAAASIMPDDDSEAHAGRAHLHELRKRDGVARQNCWSVMLCAGQAVAMADQATGAACVGRRRRSSASGGQRGDAAASQGAHCARQRPRAPDHDASCVHSDFGTLRHCGVRRQCSPALM